MNATGEFDVNLTPLEGYAEGQEGITLGRMAIHKTFHGDLSASSQGEMLSALTPVTGSAGYVALEQVVGTLSGRSGSFVLQHFGTLHQGSQHLKLEVVPDSGTSELAGLKGEMRIEVEGGRHRYLFQYELA